MLEEEQEVKTCTDCKYLLGHRSVLRTWEKEWREWRCAAPQNLIRKFVHPVHGGWEYEFRFATCEQAREQQKLDQPNNCGLEGRWFDKYVKPDFYNSQEQEPKTAATANTGRAGRKSLSSLSLDDI